MTKARPATNPSAIRSRLVIRSCSLRDRLAPAFKDLIADFDEAKFAGRQAAAVKQVGVTPPG
jgi:hypothetical protein